MNQKSGSKIEKEELVVLSNLIAKELLEKGCLVHRYISQTSNSVYLKVDGGVCKSIRISDHDGRGNMGYRYNIRLDEPDVPEVIEDTGAVQYFFPKENFLKLIQLIIDEKQRMIKKYGNRYYLKLVNKDMEANERSRGFWKSAQLLSLRNILNEVQS